MVWVMDPYQPIFSTPPALRGDGTALELRRLSQVDDDTWNELTAFVALLGPKKPDGLAIQSLYWGESFILPVNW